MPTSKNKKQVTLYLDKKVFDAFQRQYADCHKRLFANCLVLATNSREFFDNVFFGVQNDTFDE